MVFVVLLASVCEGFSQSSWTEVAGGTSSSAQAASPQPIDMNFPSSLSILGGDYEFTGADSLVVDFMNASSDTLVSFDYYFNADGSLMGPFSWSGSVNPGEEGQVHIGQFDFSQAGSHSIKLYSLSPNGQSDLNSSNDTVNIQLTVKPRPVVQDPLEDVQECPNVPVSLDADPSFASYEWSTSQSSQTLVVHTDGTYIVTLTDQFGCEAYDSVRVGFYPEPTYILGNDTVACEGASVDLEAPSGFLSYSWSASSNTARLSVDESGIYQVSVTDTNDCHFVDEVSVNFVPSPILALPEEAQVCEGDSIQLQGGNASDSHSWNTGDQTPFIYVNKSG